MSEKLEKIGRMLAILFVFLTSPIWIMPALAWATWWSHKE